MAIDITSADRGMIRYVLENLRVDDMIELTACATDLERLPDLIMRNKVFCFCAFDLELGPLAIWGLVNRRPGVGGGFAFGTEHWNMAVLPMLRQIRGFVLPFLGQTGFHRVDAVALARREDVARFMSLIGAKPEGLLRRYGCEGEDFISYRWLVDEYYSARAEREEADRPHTAH